jgi:TfoX/Sxy family transcriptional regulator of competence genes
MPYDRGLAERVRSILAPRSGFSEREMFGGIAFMMDGHMCCGVVKTDLMLRLGPESVARELQQPHTRPMTFTGKPMKSILLVDAIGTDSDEALQTWVEAAFAFVRTLPPKAAAPRRRTARSRPAN